MLTDMNNTLVHKFGRHLCCQKVFPHSTVAGFFVQRTDGTLGKIITSKVHYAKDLSF